MLESTTIREHRRPMAAPIHIVLTFDDRYWAPAYALMRSVCLFTFRRKDIRFHLFHRPLSEPDHLEVARARSRANSAPSSFPTTSTPTRPSPRSPERAHYNAASLSNIVYARVLSTKLLPRRCRAPDLSRLRHDGARAHRAALRDGHAGLPARRRARLCRRADHDAPRHHRSARHLRSGHALLQLRPAADRHGQMARSSRSTSKFSRAIDDGTLAKIYYDQDFLNLAFRENWLELDRFWNLLDPRPAHMSAQPKRPALYRRAQTLAGQPEGRLRPALPARDDQ